MTFTQDEIDLAHRLKSDGLAWTPTVGHFVWDGQGLIQHDSPFQGRVFFILELKHFLRRTESIEHLAASMVWLPTWEQVRNELLQRGVTSDQVHDHLQSTRAIQAGTERIELYRLLYNTLVTNR